MVKKNFEHKFTRFDRIHERDGQTDRPTDGRTPHDGKKGREIVEGDMSAGICPGENVRIPLSDVTVTAS